MSNTPNPPPMPTIHGTVKFFATGENKNYGFIIPDGHAVGEADMHFHFENGKFVEVGKSRPWFADQKPDQEPLRQPQAGDRVVYQAKRNGRSSARLWAYESDWEEVEREMGMSSSSTQMVSNPPPVADFPTTEELDTSDFRSRSTKDGRNHGRPDGRTRRGKRGGKSGRR